MAILETLEHILVEAGVYQYGRVDTADIRFLQEVRGMCEANTCRQYGKTWACPPAIGTVEECRARVQQYDAMLVFSVKCDLEDSFDYEGMVEGGKRFKRIARAIQQAVSRELDDYLLLSKRGLRPVQGMHLSQRAVPLSRKNAWRVGRLWHPGE